MTPEQRATAARMIARDILFPYKSRISDMAAQSILEDRITAAILAAPAQPDAAAGQSEVTRQYAEEILGNPSYSDPKVQRLAAEILGRLP